MDYSSVSIIIPTLNAADTLGDCLNSILKQNYTADKLEIIIADGGSVDSTLDIVEDLKNDYNLDNVRIVENRLKTGEAGKAAGLKLAKKDIIGFIDSDNILPDENWLRRILKPFEENEIIASEPLSYIYRRKDGAISRYCALLGMNDPLCLFLGNYDRFSLLTDRWTDMPHKSEDKSDYFKIEFNRDHIPTVGANGFFIRRWALEKCEIKDYLFDIDIIYELILNNSSYKFAKVKTGIVHIFSGNFRTFIRKQRRRIKDYTYYKKMGLRKYPWGKFNNLGILKFITFTILVLPLVIQALRGYLKKRDPAWFFHIPSCWVTLFVYSLGFVENLFNPGVLTRDQNYGLNK